MIEYAAGDEDILKSGADWLVVPVCAIPGVMGKGLALAFQREFPGLRGIHAYHCRRGELLPGRAVVTRPLWRRDADVLARPIPDERVVLLATKDHFRDGSRIEWVEQGMLRLASLAIGDRHRPRSVAVPALGCGEGGLDWPEVRRAISAHASAWPEITWLIYPPHRGKT